MGNSIYLTSCLLNLYSYHVWGYQLGEYHSTYSFYLLIINRTTKEKKRGVLHHRERTCFTMIQKQPQKWRNGIRIVCRLNRTVSSKSVNTVAMMENSFSFVLSPFLVFHIWSQSWDTLEMWVFSMEYLEIDIYSTRTVLLLVHTRNWLWDSFCSPVGRRRSILG